MTDLTVIDARARLAEVANEARRRHDPVYLTCHGQRVAAVIDADDLDQLIAAAEDLADIASARAARGEVQEAGDCSLGSGKRGLRELHLASHAALRDNNRGIMTAWTSYRSRIASSCGARRPD